MPRFLANSLDDYHLHPPRRGHAFQELQSSANQNTENSMEFPKGGFWENMSSLVSKPVVGALPHMLRDVAFNLALSVSSEAAAFDKHGFLAGFYFKHQVVTQKKRSQQQLKSLQFFMKRTNRFTSPSIFIVAANYLEPKIFSKFFRNFFWGGSKYILRTYFEVLSIDFQPFEVLSIYLEPKSIYLEPQDL